MLEKIMTIFKINSHRFEWVLNGENEELTSCPFQILYDTGISNTFLWSFKEINGETHICGQE
jgi:hypothetical protein